MCKKLKPLIVLSKQIRQIRKKQSLIFVERSFLKQKCSLQGNELGGILKNLQRLFLCQR